MAVNGFRKLPSLASAARSVLPTRRPAARAGHTASAEGKVAGTGQLKRVSVEGNIAVGKSTFARLLQDAARGWEVVPEPVSKWQNVVADDAQFDGLGAQSPVSNLLQLMYEDPARWAYTFQTFSCTSRLSTQLRPPPPGRSPPVRVYERSVYSDRYIFALTMFELGFINAAEWAVYQNWHSFLVEQFGPRVQLEGIIYLRAPPEICMKRLHKRGRKEEKDIDLAYLQKLHAQHEKWLKDRKTRVHFEHLKRVPVLVLDAGLAFDRDAEVQRRFIEQVGSGEDAASIRHTCKVAQDAAPNSHQTTRRTTGTLYRCRGFSYSYHSRVVFVHKIYDKKNIFVSEPFQRDEDET
ncbi:deoxyguanosine kinase, mitochondrial-like isoform X2 [Denticeps clupeoides]|uniref:deoxyguanosine kinase, mitochondrial-like isoform X2 n=1 Tax=Denticeps clupeoides TaxID=299321 RepID=UPI0010A325F6|nr:deoxyguanosine kinase, mitochondrial-like isoform X2 [Denticeps clupeoides]